MHMFNCRRVGSDLCYQSFRTFNGLVLAQSHRDVHSLDNGWLASILATQVGFGGTLGFLLGYGLKKVATVLLKVAALISALFMLGLMWLASIGVISVNYNAFASSVGNSFTGTMAAFLSSLVFLGQVFPMGGSFGLGFYIGAKKG